MFERDAARDLQSVAPPIERYLKAVLIDPALPLQALRASSGRAEVGRSATNMNMNMLDELAPFWGRFHATRDMLGAVGDIWIQEAGTTHCEKLTCCTATRWP